MFHCISRQRIGRRSDVLSMKLDTLSNRAVAVVSMTNIKMTNVWMMLRKCCNHPYLLEFPMTPDGQFRVDEEIVNSCGKVMLLDRMLSALIKGGHKVGGHCFYVD